MGRWENDFWASRRYVTGVGSQLVENKPRMCLYQFPTFHKPHTYSILCYENMGGISGCRFRG